ncbi:MAG: helix-turn-helix domain-containing protein [Oscillospiraceae bacterium]
MNDESRIERAERFAKIWWSSRAKAGKSQEVMALGLGVSKKTIQNWERGISSPSFFQSAEWFRILGLNPMEYYLAFLYPDQFGSIQPSSSDESIEETLMLLIKNTSPLEKRQLLFLMSGVHGSSWISLMQLFTAHCHTSMQARVAAARLILENYEMEEQTTGLVCPENVRPDMDILRQAVKEGKQAVLCHNSGYTTMEINKDDL